MYINLLGNFPLYYTAGTGTAFEWFYPWSPLLNVFIETVCANRLKCMVSILRAVIKTIIASTSSIARFCETIATCTNTEMFDKTLKSLT